MSKLNQYQNAKNIFALSFEWSINQSVLAIIKPNEVTTNSQQVSDTIISRVNAIHAAIQAFNAVYNDNDELAQDVLIERSQEVQKLIQQNVASNVPRADIIRNIINELDYLIKLLKLEVKIQLTTSSRKQIFVDSNQGFHKPPRRHHVSKPKTDSKMDKLLGPVDENNDRECCRCVIL